MGVKTPDADIDRFKPVIIFKGPFYLEAGKNNKQVHKIPIGNSKGTLKTMVIARSGKSYGSDEHISTLSLPLMVLGELPTNMGPNEKISVPVTVFSTTEKSREVQVQIKPRGSFKAAGVLNKDVEFSESGTETIFFDLETTNKIGKAGLSIQVKSGTHKDTYETALDVLPLNNTRRKVINPSAIDPGEIWTAKIPWSKNSIDSKLFIELNSPLLRGWFRRLSDLQNFPESNSEIIVSKSFPLIYLAANPNIDKDLKEKYVAEINRSISKVLEYQLENGAVSYWNNSYENYDWLTNYAGHFMLEAERAGYHVNPIFFKRWIAFQKRKSYTWDQKDRLMQAYRLYLLTLANEQLVGSMNQMNYGDSKNSIADWLLAAAYQQMGNPELAESISSGLPTDSLSPIIHWRNNLGSETRDKALVLLSMGLVEKNSSADALSTWLKEKLFSEEELNSHETALSMIAILKYTPFESTVLPIKIDYRINSGSWQSVFSQNTHFHKLLGNRDIRSLEIKNAASISISPQIILEESIDSLSSNELSMEVNFYKGQCKSTPNTWKEVRGNSFSQGSDIIVGVKVKSRNQRNIDNLFLNQNFPAGFQIISTECNLGNTPSYQFVQDQRVSTFFNLTDQEALQKTFYIQLHASYKGEFEFPAFELMAKYDGSIYTSSKRRRISITSN